LNQHSLSSPLTENIRVVNRLKINREVILNISGFCISIKPQKDSRNHDDQGNNVKKLNQPGSGILSVAGTELHRFNDLRCQLIKQIRIGRDHPIKQVDESQHCGWFFGKPCTFPSDGIFGAPAVNTYRRDQSKSEKSGRKMKNFCNASAQQRHLIFCPLRVKTNQCLLAVASSSLKF